MQGAISSGRKTLMLGRLAMVEEVIKVGAKFRTVEPTKSQGREETSCG